MKTCTVAEIGRRPSSFLNSGESYVVTNNGRPTCLMTPLDGLDMAEAVDLSRRLQGLNALATLQRQSIENGLDTLTDEEIEAEIAAVRQR